MRKGYVTNPGHCYPLDTNFHEGRRSLLLAFVCPAFNIMTGTVFVKCCWRHHYPRHLQTDWTQESWWVQPRGIRLRHCPKANPKWCLDWSSFWISHSSVVLKDKGWELFKIWYTGVGHELDFPSFVQEPLSGAVLGSCPRNSLSPVPLQLSDSEAEMGRDRVTLWPSCAIQSDIWRSHNVSIILSCIHIPQ